MSELITCVVLKPLTVDGSNTLLPAGKGAEPVTVELAQEQIDILRPMGVVELAKAKAKPRKTAASAAKAATE